MADYRLSVLVAKRSDGRSATSMAAYRAGEVIHDHRTGERFDYTRKTGVLYAEVIAPAGAPEWARDREQLWNRSEERHTHKNAVIAREIQLSLPHELTDQQRRELTASFAGFMADRYSVAVDTCIHAPGKDGDDRNHHAHLLICTRPIDETAKLGLGNNERAFDAVAGQRTKDGNHVELWRSTWADMMNDTLQRADIRTAEGVTVVVDHRSYKRQGIDQEPTIKEGTAATASKRRGEYTERAEINNEIRTRNDERREISREIDAISRQIEDLHQLRAESVSADNQPDHDLAARLPAEDQPANSTPIRRHALRLTVEETEAALKRFERMPWETEEQWRESATKAAERASQHAANDNEPQRAPGRSIGGL